jgi:hypothetical protein
MFAAPPAQGALVPPEWAPLRRPIMHQLIEAITFTGPD